MSSRRHRGFSTEWPLVIFTTALQIATAMAIAQVALPAFDFGRTRRLGVAMLVVLVLGIAASLAHLGRPVRAWRALLNLPSSPVSAEAAATVLFALAALLSCVTAHADAFAAAAGVAAVIASARVYMAVAENLWRRWVVLLVFALSTLFYTLFVAGSELGLSTSALDFAVGACAVIATAHQVTSAARRFGCKGIGQTS